MTFSEIQRSELINKVKELEAENHNLRETLEVQMRCTTKDTARIAELEAENKRLQIMLDRVDKILVMVDEQANDDGLWFDAKNITEAYLQQELRRLHAALEGGE